MTPEQGFLDAIRAHPGDDVNRLVYADWLEEQGDLRGAYIRRELELAAMALDDPDYAECEADLRQRRRTLDPRWVNEVGRAYDLVLMDYPPTQKIRVIKEIRQLTGCGLLEAKNLAESLPAVVWQGVSRTRAEAGRKVLSAIESVKVVIRLSRSASRPPPQPLSSEPGYALVLTAFDWPRWNSLVEAIMRVKECDRREAETSVYPFEPTTLRVFATEDEAREAAKMFNDCAVVEVWPSPGWVAGNTPHPRLDGLCDVVLRGYAPEQKIALIRLVRELANIGLRESKELIERPLPVTLFRNQSPVEANQIRLRLESVCGVGLEPANG
jgi:uncharacterized protein (TIGR02996 family)